MNDKFVEVACTICGKHFIPAAKHVYRDKRLCNGPYVCSYTCMIKSEKKAEAMNKKMKPGTPIRIECDDGFRGTMKEVCKHLGQSQTWLRYRVRLGMFKILD